MCYNQLLISHSTSELQAHAFIRWVAGRDSSIGIAIHYGLDGPGIKSRWGWTLPCRPDRPQGPPSLLYNGYPVFPEGKATEACSWQFAVRGCPALCDCRGMPWVDVYTLRRYWINGKHLMDTVDLTTNTVQQKQLWQYYRHTLRIFHMYCFSTATMVTRTRLYVHGLFAQLCILHTTAKQMNSRIVPTLTPTTHIPDVTFIMACQQ